MMGCGDTPHLAYLFKLPAGAVDERCRQCSGAYRLVDDNELNKHFVSDLTTTLTCPLCCEAFARVDRSIRGLISGSRAWLVNTSV